MSFKTKVGTSWKSAVGAYVKVVTWRYVKRIYANVNGVWKLFFSTDAPVKVTGPSIRLTSYTGPLATSPQTLDANLYGKDGSYTNYTSISGRKFSWGDTSDSTLRNDIVISDLYTSGVSGTDRLSVDEKYLFYELTVSNGTSPLDSVEFVSDPVYMIKQAPPYANSILLSGVQQPGNYLTVDFKLQNYYYNRLEYVNSSNSSVVRWWRSPGPYKGGTLVQEDTLYFAYSTISSTELVGSSSYYVTNDDLGSYLYFEIIGRNSYTRYYGYSDYQVDWTNTSAAISGPITFSNFYVTDSSSNSGTDNRGNIPASGSSIANITISGVDSTTTYRTRYRAYNNNTGVYKNPDTNVTGTAADSWFAYTADATGSGSITSVSINGNTATLTDNMAINSSYFNGGTYSGGNPTWRWDIEISAIKSGGSRVYYTTSYNLSPSSTASISVSPSQASTSDAVTISGNITAVPSNYTAYPKQYKVDYGDGSDSGWLPYGEWSNGTGNPTYSLTHTYSTTGTYYPSVTTIPYYTINNATLSIVNMATAPTSVSAVANAYNDITVYWSGGSGVYYRVWFSIGSTPPSGSASTNYDIELSSSPWVWNSSTPSRFNAVPTGNNTYYFWVSASNDQVTWTPYSSSPRGTATTPAIPAPVQTSTPKVGNGAGSYASGGYIDILYPNGVYWTGGSYNNASSVTSVLMYTTAPANFSSPTSDTTTNYQTSNPYSLAPGDGLGSPYYYSVRDTVVGLNGTTYYYYSYPNSYVRSQPGSALTPSLSAATSTDGGFYFDVYNYDSSYTWSASVTSGTGTASGPTSSYPYRVTVTGMGSAANSTVTVTASKSGYNTGTSTRSGTSNTVVTYSFTYNANGGSTTPTQSAVTYGTFITLASGAGTRSGYSFGGWDIGGVTYSGGSSYQVLSNTTATAIWNVVFTTPTCVAPSLQFQPRSYQANTLKWYCDYPSPSGSVSSITGMQFEIRTTAGGGTLLASNTRAYPGAGSYPYSANGSIWAFAMGTAQGDITYSASARYGRARVVMVGTNGTTYYGTWSGWL